jgi:CRP/FNR family cyclic AMP-dependent transcriptional regulator
MSPRFLSATSFVAANGWLASCSPAFRDWMLAQLQWQQYRNGDGVSHAGDTEGALYCVVEGQVRFAAGVGVADIGSSYFGLPGTWWGHAPLLGGKRLGSIVAAGETLCGAVPVSLLRTRLAGHPEDWQAITLGIADLFQLSAGGHADLLIPDSQRRVAATILRLGGRRHRLFRIAPPAQFLCTHEELAGATALSRNTIGKLLRQFEQAGLVDSRYGRIAIIDSRRLRALVDA